MMKLRFLCLLIFVSVMSACSRPEANTRIVRNGDYKQEILDARELLRSHLVVNQTGLTVSASVGRELVWSEGLGYANKELHVGAEPQHKFRIGSLSGLLNSMLALKLEEEGVVDLDKPYADYVDANEAWSFSLMNLANYTAGFDQMRDEMAKKQAFNGERTLDSLVYHYRNEPLRYQPGTSFAESTFGVCLLGHALEKASGKKYRTLFKELTDTLQLEETLLEPNRAIIDNRATPYYTNYIAQIINCPDINIYPIAPAFGVLSTADELNKLGQMILYKEGLSKESYEKLLNPSVLKNGQKSPWGMGVMNGIDGEGREYYYMAGKTVGGASMLVVYPKLNFVFAACGNLSEDLGGYPFFEIVNAFVQKLDGKQPQ